MQPLPSAKASLQGPSPGSGKAWLTAAEGEQVRSFAPLRVPRETCGISV